MIKQVSLKFNQPAISLKEQIILAMSNFPKLFDTSGTDYNDVNKKTTSRELVGARVNLSGRCSIMFLQVIAISVYSTKLSSSYLRP